MEISVLATKCRYCGEEVGRPRDEARTLSIDDLGGDQATHYAPSSNVMEALEAFRSDEVVEGEEESDSGGEKRGEAYQKKHADSNLPELDAQSRALSSLAMPAKKPTGPKKPEKPPWMRQVAYLGGFIATVLILWFGAPKVMAYINKPEEVQEKVIRIPPSIHDLLKKDGGGMAAVLAIKEVRTRQGTNEEVQDVTNQAREKLAAEIEDLLNQASWDNDPIGNASNLAERAAQEDPNARFIDLQNLIQDERRLYNMRLETVEYESRDEASATFRVDVTGETPGAEVVTISYGPDSPEKPLMLERFKVLRIGRDSVVLIDQARNRRRVTYREGMAGPQG
jgi:hypothetical protein